MDTDSTDTDSTDTDSDGTTIQGGDDTPTTPAEPPLQTVPFLFTGSGGEYFRIWIVNLFLTIVTLGIYSAWAKVRTYTYFYGNTWLDGNNFTYHAKPMAILKGRLLAVACLAIYGLLAASFPVIGLGLNLLLLMLLPWLVVRSLRFNAVNSSYRNVRFDFRGKWGGAAMVILVWPLISLLTLSLLSPVFLKKQQEYVIRHHSYGASSFDFEAGYGGYYRTFFGAVGIFVAACVLGVLASFTLGFLLGLTGLQPAMPEEMSYVIVYVVAALGYLLAFAFLQAALFNIAYQGGQLDGHGFAADMTTKGYAKLIGLNILGMIVTLGLFYPFAKVRTARYMADHLAARLASPLDDYVTAEAERVGALGGELAGALDLDISI